MTKDEMKDKYSAFITEISEIMGLGKPIDIIKLCATTDLFFQPLEKRIKELEKENAELKEQIEKMKTCCNCEYWRIGAEKIRHDDIPCYQHDCDCKGCVDWKLFDKYEG